MDAVDGTTHDVVILGGGVMGAALFDRLADGGRRVLLCDRGDFAAGTSQASAMLVWGGLLYLRHGDFREVVRLSDNRDRWLASQPALAEPHRLAYVFGDRSHADPRRVRVGLWLYWLLGRCRRRPPHRTRRFDEQRFLNPASAAEAVRYEEGRLRVSDAQLVMHWLRPSATSRAVNHCGCVGGGFDPRQQRWELDLLDARTGRAMRVTAKYVVNATGVWVDSVNDLFGVRSPWQHLLAKGASLCVPRPAGHRDTLVFDGAEASEGYSFVPWGPVSLWGSTEQRVESPEDARVSRGDVDELLGRLNRHLRSPVERDDIVSLRCGVRGLVVPGGTSAGDPLRVSKRWRVHVDADRPWASIYGGKITSSPAAAQHAAAMLDRRLGRATAIAPRPDLPEADTEAFPGLSMPVPTAAWCRQWQSCRTLDDYLRRRTNIAQWLPRGGLGRTNEHRERLLAIAAKLHDDPAAAVEAYERTVEREHDAVLGTEVGTCLTTP